jgi:hypothetical protein
MTAWRKPDTSASPNQWILQPSWDYYQCPTSDWTVDDTALQHGGPTEHAYDGQLSSYEDFKGNFSTGHACYSSVRLIYPCVQVKNLNYRVYKTRILFVALYRCDTTRFQEKSID